ncbi:cell surface protein SprA, partial [Robiginitalea sp.]|uniref:T9SS outer membrane translocon Sov/SprA n=1 Tax=Robiginitalea sp. TaxID=1902411 RepID=UPI003C710C1E
FYKNDSILNGSYWQWLKDFNLNLLPTSVSVQSDVNRQFNQQRFRDVLEPGVESLELPLLQQRNYLFNWQYTLNYAITKSLRVNLTAANNNIIRNYFADPGNPFSEIDQELNVWDGFFDTGEANRHAQQMQLNYELPFSKIPILDFINAQYTYTSNFEWQRGGDALNLAVAKEQNPGVPEDQLVLTSINSVQNASTHSLTATLTMQRLYDQLGLKKTGGKATNQIAAPRSRPGDPNEEGAAKPPKKTSKLANVGIDILTMVKRLNINYLENNGSVLPGYTQSVGFIGTTKPTLGFVFGSQADVRFEAARKGWLTDFQEFNQQFIRRTNKQLSLTATALPVPELTIDLLAERQFSSSRRENFRIEDGDYIALTPNTFGTFSISTIMIGTAFSSSDEFDSATFETFKENRLTVANRLQAEGNLPDTGRDEEGFPNLYGKTSQDVLLPSFFAAYTGKDPEKVNLGAFRDIPLPNWNIKYTGLMKNKWFRKKFKRFSLSHGYRAAYSINSFQTNLERDQLISSGEDPLNPETGDLLPENIINNVVLNDAFNPLIRVDFEMQNSLSVLAEVRTDRALSMSFDNNLLTEINGREYSVGLGYRIRDVNFVTRIGGERTRLKGDLNFKADVSLRDNITIIRNLDLDNNQVTSGQNLLSIKFTIDYALTKSLNALFFYDHNFSQFAVSTAFPQTTINTGFTLRYNFGN